MMNLFLIPCIEAGNVDLTPQQVFEIFLFPLQVYGHERPDDGATKRFNQTGRRQRAEGQFLLVYQSKLVFNCL